MEFRIFVDDSSKSADSHPPWQNLDVEPMILGGRGCHRTPMWRFVGLLAPFFLSSILIGKWNQMRQAAKFCHPALLVFFPKHPLVPVVRASMSVADYAPKHEVKAQ